MFEFFNRLSQSSIDFYCHMPKEVHAVFMKNIKLHPIQKACAEGNINEVKILFKQGVDLNQLFDGQTLLSMACNRNHVEVFKYLLDHGARDSSMETDLYTACSVGHYDMVDYLLKIGTDFTSKLINKNSLLHKAAEKGHVEIIHLLINKGLSVHDVNKDGLTPLHMACINGHEKAAEALIKNGADIQAGSYPITLPDGVESDISPLHISAYYGYQNLVEYLINLGADVNAKSAMGMTALHAACFKGNLECIKTLKLHHAEMNTKYINLTPLHIASFKYSYDVVDYLIKDTNIDINAKDDKNRTPLHLAALYGRTEIIKLLVEHNADIEARTTYGCTPLSIAKAQNVTEVVKYLTNISKGNDGTLFEAVKENDPMKLEYAIQQGANVNSIDKKNDSPLIIASKRGYYKIIEILIKHNADVNISSKNNSSALHYAAKYNHIEIVHYLLQHGAKYDTKTIIEKKTPCDFAVQDSDIHILLKLIDKLFVQVRRENIVNEVLMIKDENTENFMSIINACNFSGDTLMKLNLANTTKDVAKSFPELVDLHHEYDEYPF